MRDDICGKCGRGVIPGYLWAYEDLFVCEHCFPFARKTEKPMEVKLCKECGKPCDKVPPFYDGLGLSDFKDKAFCSSECLKDCRVKYLSHFLATEKQYDGPTDNDPLLLRAQKLICGDRQRDYGDKLQNFAQTAMIWTGIVAHKLSPGQTITPEDVCLMMIGLKMSRLAKSPDHKDSVLDIAGYTGCYDMLQGERERGVKLSGSTHDSGSTQDSGKSK